MSQVENRTQVAPHKIAGQYGQIWFKLVGDFHRLLYQFGSGVRVEMEIRHLGDFKTLESRREVHNRDGDTFKGEFTRLIIDIQVGCGGSQRSTQSNTGDL